MKMKKIGLLAAVMAFIMVAGMLPKKAHADNTLTFTPNEPLTEDAEYKYTLNMSGYEDATGTFMGNETQGIALLFLQFPDDRLGHVDERDLIAGTAHQGADESAADVAAAVHDSLFHRLGEFGILGAEQGLRRFILDDFGETADRLPETVICRIVVDH